jgi:hypothetical protein
MAKLHNDDAVDLIWIQKHLKRPHFEQPWSVVVLDLISPNVIDSGVRTKVERLILDASRQAARKQNRDKPEEASNSFLHTPLGSEGGI